MSRIPTVLATTAASAVVATGVAAINAVGDDHGSAPGAARAKLSHCQRTAADRRRCKAHADGRVAPPAELLSCLRAHGLQPPTALDELKLWIMRTPAARACVPAPDKDPAGAGKPGDGGDPGCGGKKPDPDSSATDTAPE
jgi:hypothetical protein